jgi:hypothetical protein
MNLYDNLGNETINKEYKIFIFNPLLISQEDAYIHLLNGKFNFNKSTLHTIKNYIKIYLPKYISSYFNPKSNLSEAYLYFGISDNGKIYGIPYIGNISKKFIEKQINIIINKNLKFMNEMVKNEIKNNIDIEIIKINKIHTNNYDTVYSEYKKQLDIIKLEHIKYNKKKNIWNKLFNEHILKLHEFINDYDTRNDIIQYIYEINNYSKKNFNNKYSHLFAICDVPDYWTFISKLKTNYKYNPPILGEIKNIKSDKLNIYYWVTRWKDSKMAMLKYAKPKIPKKSIDNSYPIFLLSQVIKMIPQWIEMNPKLNLFIIKITFNINSHHLIEYKDIKNNWKISYRTTKFNEPLSIPYL